jgi:hypothetical protein
MIPFWCLMPKGEKLRPKQEMDQLPLENFKNSRVRAFVLSKYSYGLLLSKIGLVGRMFDYGKKGEPLENFENSRVRAFVLQNTLMVSYCQKLVLWGECLIMGKRGSF